MDELTERVTELGGRPFHARVAREALLKGARSYEEMTSLPADLRDALNAEIPLLSSEVRHSTRSPFLNLSPRSLLKIPVSKLYLKLSIISLLARIPDTPSGHVNQEYFARASAQVAFGNPLPGDNTCPA